MIQLNPLLVLGLFAAMFCVAVVHTLYIRRVGQGRPGSAGFWSVVSFVLSGLVVYEYVQNLSALIPAAVGDFLGTYLVVCYEVRTMRLVCCDCRGQIPLVSEFQGNLRRCPNCQRAYAQEGGPLLDDERFCPVYFVGSKVLPLHSILDLACRTTESLAAPLMPQRVPLHLVREAALR